MCRSPFLDKAASLQSETLLKKNPTGIFLQLLRKFQQNLLYKTTRATVAKRNATFEELFSLPDGIFKSKPGSF